MDAAKGPRERPVYPALCWAVDDYAEVGVTYVLYCVFITLSDTICSIPKIWDHIIMTWY